MMIVCVNSPCKDCKAREMGCHSTCDAYKLYKDKLESVRGNIRSQNFYEGYKQESIRKRVRKEI